MNQFLQYIKCGLLMGVMAFNMAAMAETKVWTLADGRTFEGSFVTLIGKNYVFNSSAGKQLKIPVQDLSEEDRLLVELSSPPELEIDFIRNLNTVTFSEGYYGAFPREPEQHGNFGVRVRQTSSGRYKHELHAELYVIAQQIGVSDKKCFLLDVQKTDFQLLDENKRTFEFMSQHQVRLENWHFEYSDSIAVDRGEIYYGYLVAIQDSRGEVIAIQTSKEWLKDGFDNLRKLGVGNFFDKECVRCFPGRPDPLRW